MSMSSLHAVYVYIYAPICVYLYNGKYAYRLPLIDSVLIPISLSLSLSLSLSPPLPLLSLLSGFMILLLMSQEPLGEHEIIDLCSTSSDEEATITRFSPVKSQLAPIDIVKEMIPSVRDDDYHDPQTKRLPVLSRTVSGLGVTQLFTLTIGSVPPNKICTCKPTSVTYSSVFVVDLSCVKSIDDLRADDNGVWLHSGKPRRKYKVEFDSNRREIISATVVNKGSNSDDSDVYTLVRIYHRHKATPEFQRHICYILDATNRTVRYAVVQYLFEDGIEVPVILPPHGNSKNTTAYRRTQPSTLKKLKEEHGKPKAVISNVYKEAGGSAGALSASELPRDRRQVYNARQHSSLSTMKDGKVDPLFELIKTCKEDLLPGGRKFIRHVSIDSSPSCVLATDSQLSNLHRFYTVPGELCVLGIDPTFNLGKFYVTVTTYTYLHVENKISHTSPTFFGPMFVHTEKTYESYYYFSTLLKL